MSFDFYSGFCLNKEKELFSEYIIENDFTISGFSYGAIKAFKKALGTNRRVDLLQMFSPAFFQDKDKKFKRTQLMYFKKDSTAYCDTFMKNVIFPKKVDISKYFEIGRAEQLEELLSYEWTKQSLETLQKKGTKIEVYLGAKDKIINSREAKEFFKDFTTVYFFNELGHIL
ncbi:hypothetical protein CPU12_01415 [Malaciobacter molluscorum LMG 25693]|uniref:Pimelyl-ACP methyl ester esterase BioV n=1 Tax=Malaciobacter molluscorum LMG 25693 TaxID=870501 RepID=A0A2G1DM92_9BACT|nr:pimelyl-ACP methyl ester esterase BioV [Malaciobacter molluscorum]AXX92239.1 hypothetical protein AMOL_1258 [Malaciobacter molluscorum LMG 25693]PHO19466.1 hypothetical protein CPU12_01415 [Malaciobacter molluscorum LMG 25693]